MQKCTGTVWNGIYICINPFRDDLFWVNTMHICIFCSVNFNLTNKSLRCIQWNFRMNKNIHDIYMYEIWSGIKSAIVYTTVNNMVCCVVLCCVGLGWVGFCCAVLCSAVSCHVMSCYVILCYVMNVYTSGTLVKLIHSHMFCAMFCAMLSNFVNENCLDFS